MIDDRCKKYEPFFGKWKIEKDLGKGAYGQVYEIYWEDGLGGRATSALKFMHIPSDEALAEQKAIQPDMEAVRKFFLRKVDKITNEIRILQQCKGHSNIVSYEDHLIVENAGEDEIGWDILIRMELLYPLKTHLSGAGASQYDVICLWRDISNALIYCEEQGIVHRDIKPANILISKTGNYKLSDFGIARQNLQSDETGTFIGTPRFMAPEVYLRQRYDKRADYYSLGLVIYNFLNKGRLPFYPPASKILEDEDIRKADDRRLSGEKVPRIDNVSKEINKVLQKALEFEQKKRYQSAREMYNVVQKLLDAQEEELKQKLLNGKTAPTGSTSTTQISPGKDGKKKSGGMTLPIVIAGVFLVAGIGGVVYGVSQKAETKKSVGTEISQEAEETGTSGKGAVEAPHEKKPEKKQEEAAPASEATATPTPEPTATPTPEPTATPTPEPTATPTPEPTATPTPEPTATPTPEPTATPTPEPTATPTPEPTATPTPEPTATPTPEPTATPTPEPTATPTPEPTATPTPVPALTEMGKLERPTDGDSLTDALKIKGWVLTNDKIGDIEVYADFVQNDKTVYSCQLEPKVSGDETFKKRQKKYATEIAASKGYEIKESQELTNVPEGSYTLNLRMKDTSSKEEKVLDSVSVTVSGSQAESSGNVMDLMGIDQNSVKQATHFLDETKGYAVGADMDEKDPSIKANADQILLTGWINAEKGTSIGMYFEIDSQVYTVDTLAAQGGSCEVIRAPRYLEKMDSSLIGGAVKDSTESGYIAVLKLPFLDNGTHTLSVSLNITSPGAQPDLLDLVPITLNIDSGVVVNENAAADISASWAKEFPKPVATATPTTAPEKSGQ